MSLSSVSMMLFPIANCRFSEPASSVWTFPIDDFDCFQSAIGNWQSAMLLFISQRHQRIDFRCAPRWEPARSQSHDCQQRRDDREGQRVSPRHAVKLLRHLSLPGILCEILARKESL